MIMVISYNILVETFVIIEKCFLSGKVGQLQISEGIMSIVLFVVLTLYRE